MRFENENEVLATVRASAGRRILGLGALGLLGVLLIYISLFHPPALGWRVFLLLMGIGALWGADLMRRATASAVELTPLGLRDADGTVIAPVEEIEAIDRGFFAFKPSNGFLLKTKAAQPGIWRPGLWWRTGRRIGVGGMTPGYQSKVMAEIIAAMLLERGSDG
ncbi:MAG: hypothetical protein AAF755_08310 [Pseudomonadota bacterium]